MDSVTNIEGDELADQNIYFSLITEEDKEELTTFLYANFFNSEPISKCEKLLDWYGPVDFYVWYHINDLLVGQPLSKNETGINCSLIAREKNTSDIVGCVIGAIYSKDEIKTTADIPNWMSRLPFRLFYKLNFESNLDSLQRDLHYSHQDAFDDLPQAPSIHFCEVLCVSETARGKGLGYELTRRACKIALGACCRYTYTFATSMFSQRLFHKFNGCNVLHEVKYKDYEYDANSRPFLLDHGAHEVLQVISLDHTLN